MQSLFTKDYFLTKCGPENIQEAIVYVQQFLSRTVKSQRDYYFSITKLFVVVYKATAFL